MSEQAKCALCGEPMPEGEEMFEFHGYSGNCPKPPLPAGATWEELQQHIRECEKHPLHAVTAERDRLAKELEEAKNKIFAAKEESATYRMQYQTQGLHVDSLTAERDRLAKELEEAKADYRGKRNQYDRAIRVIFEDAYVQAACREDGSITLWIPSGDYSPGNSWNCRDGRTGKYNDKKVQSRWEAYVKKFTL